ncbi:MAG: biotin--[acetyl-CoA-carboxylase] ligase [Parvularculaceae bacterium]
MSGLFSSGASLVLYQRLDSTNLEAKRRAADGVRGPMWIVAEEQTQGYGRRGAPWVQSAGDVAATYLFDPRAKAETLGQLSFVAGLAVADTIAHFAPRAPLTLKWPNDVLLDGGKISGILLELVSAAGGNPLVALGVGVNIVSKPATADYPTARLIDHLDVAPPRPTEFLRELDASLARWVAQWREAGFAPIRKAWLEIAAGLGAKISVRLPTETIEAVFRDLDQSGALILDCAGTPRLVSAGAVFPAPAPNPGE